MLIDVPSTPRFLVNVFSFVVHAEFEVGVLALEEFRWKIFPDEDLEPLVTFAGTGLYTWMECQLHQE